MNKTFKTSERFYFTVNSNYVKKTFTLRFYDGEKCRKYRTSKFRDGEFSHAYHYWSHQDWIDFLKTNKYVAI